MIPDKSGDVYAFKLSEPESEHLLGHLSMLLDILISPDNKYVLTCDRDEKIRVTHYPNAYNIRGFCLGHTEFITGFTFVSGQSNVLASASGDGSIRIWDFLKVCNRSRPRPSFEVVHLVVICLQCKELTSTVCYTDLDMPELDPGVEDEQDKETEEQFRRKRRTTPAVKSVQAFKYADDLTLIIAVVEGYVRTLGITVFSYMRWIF